MLLLLFLSVNRDNDEIPTCCTKNDWDLVMATWKGSRSLQEYVLHLYRPHITSPFLLAMHRPKNDHVITFSTQQLSHNYCIATD